VSGARGKRTTCWWCGRRLALPHFAVVVIDGAKHIVHKCCKEDVPKPITAQPRAEF
jgi:hypothetical protein